MITSPFRVRLGALKHFGNSLEIEVTILAANRNETLTGAAVAGKSSDDVNFVNLAYQPFDAAEWPVRPSGLLGPVQFIPMKVL